VISPAAPGPALVVLSGGRAGQTLRLDGSQLTVGRHPGAGLQLDPLLDLSVSGLHAELSLDGSGEWVLRDLGSRNGTFVNGARVGGTVRLTSGDQIRLGLEGPRLEFRGPDWTGAIAISPGSGTASPGGEPDPIAGSRAGGSTFDSAPRAIAASVLIVALVGTAIWAVGGLRQESTMERERAAFRQQLDSVTRAGQAVAQSLEVQVADLADALRRSEEEIQVASAQLQQGQRAPENSQVTTLTRELRTATENSPRTSSNLDIATIQRTNRRAVAMIYVEAADGSVSTGTAFAVRSDATLLTSRHVLGEGRGEGAPRRLAIQFADSEQVWPARVLAISRESDLAVVKIDNIIGEVPTVLGLNQRPDTLRAGGLVASIGFPTGGILSADLASSRRTVARPVLSAGIISAVDADELQYQGYGAAGASGSPVFDAAGEVAAILFGGIRDSTPPTLIAVPASAAARLLQTIP
jgi:S1-C subfamily serine protease